MQSNNQLLEKDRNVNNGLFLKEIKSQVPDQGQIDTLEHLDQFIADKFKAATGQAVLYLHYGIRFATWQDRTLHFYNNEKINPGAILELRIFNPDQELRLWKTASGYRFRLRVDGSGGDCSVIQARQKLWGTRAESLANNWTRLYEDRGTELVVPLDITYRDGESKPLAFLATRSYIGYMANDQATFVDNRFLSVLP